MRPEDFVVQRWIEDREGGTQTLIVDEMFRARRAEARLEERLDQAAASLGAKVAEVARLERELALAKAAIPEMVTCSGCGCHALVIDLGWNTRQYHFAAGGLCGHWLQDGKPWVLDCEPPEDVVDETTEVGEQC